jgi:hypothetical protein
MRHCITLSTYDIELLSPGVDTARRCYTSSLVKPA